SGTSISWPSFDATNARMAAISGVGPVCRCTPPTLAIHFSGDSSLSSDSQMPCFSSRGPVWLQSLENLASVNTPPRSIIGFRNASPRPRRSPVAFATAQSSAAPASSLVLIPISLPLAVGCSINHGPPRLLRSFVIHSLYDMNSSSFNHVDCRLPRHRHKAFWNLVRFQPLNVGEELSKH